MSRQVLVEGAAQIRILPHLLCVQMHGLHVVSFVLSQHVDWADAAIRVLSVGEPLQLRRARVVPIAALALEPFGLF